jgi:hypothetical protein
LGAARASSDVGAVPRRARLGAVKPPLKSSPQATSRATTCAIRCATK